jgi:hypothetical protein
MMKSMTNPKMAERHLPNEILERASLRDDDYAWPVGDIPLVIEAARRSNLVNIGGQLQFRLPDGTTWECYWVEVDACRTVLESLPWAERVAQTAEIALANFAAISTKFDFLEEGRRNFGTAFKDAETRGYDLHEAMCFVWYAAERKI